MNRRLGDRGWLLGMLLAAAVGCDLPGKPGPADRFQRPEDVLDFQTLYGENCAACHGAHGRVGPGPPLNDDLFRAIIPTEQLAMVIRAGRRGTMMPAFARDEGGTLTDAQIEVLVKEIKGISYRSAEDREIEPAWGAARPVEGAPSYLAPADARGDRDAGARLFESACANCHGEQGQGYDRKGKRVLRINDPAFLALSSDQFLRRIIITGRRDLEMPDYASDSGRELDFTPLTSQQISDLTALLAYWRQGGALSRK
jgi:mono/diheme cytochrome c family protein